MPLSTSPRQRPTAIETREATSLTHRVSIGLIAISLSLMSLALGLTLLTMPLPASVFVAAPATPQSTPSTATAVTLTWTAPGDDANIGQATSYDLRYSSDPLTALNFSQATSVTDVPTPQVAGALETYTVTGLQPATTYFFGLKTSDEAGNVSALSNIVAKTTDALARACVPTYTCSSWSACLNGQQTRTCPTTNGCPAGLDQPIEHQSCTVPSPDAPPATPNPTPSPSPTPSTAPSGGGTVRLLNHLIVAGAAPGTLPIFRIIDPTSLKVRREILAFARSDRHGVNVAVGDLDGDHQPDVVVGTGAGSSPQVKLFTAQGNLVASFQPYPTNSTSGVAVALGDINADGRDELLTIPAKGPAQLRAFTYDRSTKKITQLAQTFVFDRSQQNGFTLAMGDLNVDGRSDVIVAPRTNGASVSVLKFANQQFTTVTVFKPFNRVFSSGLTVAVGDVDGNGRPDLITTAGPGFYAYVKVFNVNGTSARPFFTFLPTSLSYLGGLTLAALDTNQDGRDEILTGTYRSGDPGMRVYNYSGLTHTMQRLETVYVYPKSMQAGLRLGSQ